LRKTKDLHSGPQPVFVIGSGRCGSTLLAELLDAHPRVVMLNEARLVDFLHFVNALASQPAFEEREHVLHRPVRVHGVIGRAYAPRFADVVREHTGPMLLEFYRRQFPDQDFVWFGDKLPSPEAAHALAALFPGQRCLTLVRDPRDVVCSMRDYYARPDVSANGPPVRLDDLEAYCRQWRGLYEGCLDHLAGNLLVRYEDLVLRQEQELARVMAHLGLDVHAAQLMAEPREATRIGHATTPSAAASVGRWRRDLPDADARLIARACAGVLRRCGYGP
jgi:hypothetical protein